MHCHGTQWWRKNIDSIQPSSILTSFFSRHRSLATFFGTACIYSLFSAPIAHALSYLGSTTASRRRTARRADAYLK